MKCLSRTHRITPRVVFNLKEEEVTINKKLIKISVEEGGAVSLIQGKDILEVLKKQDKKILESILGN